MVPPVYSPVGPRSVLKGIAANAGMLRSPQQSLVDALCQRFSASDALLTDSGTSALVLALRQLVPPGGTVAFPGYGCVDLSAAAVRAGVQVRLYDLDPTTMSPDLESVRASLSRGVAAIVVAHLYGYPADVPGVIAVAADRGVPVIEDAAQAAGGVLRGALLGTMGDISILSFGRGKGITAGGGGAVLVRTPALVEWTNAARALLPSAAKGGKEIMGLAAQWMLANSALYRLPSSMPGLQLGEMVYHPAHEPRSISVAARAMLPHAMDTHAAELETRRRNAYELRARLQANALKPIDCVPGGEPGFLRFACRDVVGDMVPEAVFGFVRGYPQTLDQHAALRQHLGRGETAGPGSRVLRDRLFTMPTHSRVSRADLTRLVEFAGRDGRGELAPSKYFPSPVTAL